MIINYDYNSMYPNMPSQEHYASYGNWEKKFIFLKKIRNDWVFFKTVYMRRRLCLAYQRYEVQYALNDFDMIKMG